MNFRALVSSHTLPSVFLNIRQLPRQSPQSLNPSFVLPVPQKFAIFVMDRAIATHIQRMSHKLTSKLMLGDSLLHGILGAVY
jgi:hypothetical protein